MKEGKTSAAAPVMFVLAGVATTLPVFAGYVMGFCLTLWLVSGGRWRLALLGAKHLPKPGEPDHALMQAVAAGIKPLHWGVLALISSHLLAALLAVWWSPWAKPLGQTLAGWSHTAVKDGLLWFVLSAAMIVSVRRGWNPRRLGPYLLAWLVVQLAYCLLQHWTGVDWTHGFHAVLGSRRFAYGVYRVSGFMGHPLTFAYNHMLILLAGGAMAWRLSQGQPAQRRVWLGVTGLCLVTLLISGSRYVLLVVAAAVLLCEYRRLWASRLWVAALGVGIAALLWAEGSVVARFAEVLSSKAPLLERFPRLVFWQIHWQMFLDQPLFGTGMAGLDDALTAYYTAAGYRDNMYTAHNLLLQYLADTGVVGTLGLLLWFASALVARLRLSRMVGSAQGLGYLLSATVLCALMQNNLRDSAYVYCLWFYLSLLIIQSAVLYARQQEVERHDREPPQNLQSRADSAHPAAHL